MHKQAERRSPTDSRGMSPHLGRPSTTGPAAMFELARLAHEKAAMGKLARALQRRLDSVSRHIQNMEKRTKLLLRFIKPSNAGRELSREESRRTTRLPGAEQSQAAAARRLDRQPPNSMRVMSWKF